MTDVASTRSDRTARVLLIQDEATRRDEVASALRGAGFEVVEAANGLSGIEKATSNPPDLLLLDLHLPDLDGAEVASKLRRLGMQGLPIVAMGQPGTERGLALSAGCDGTIPSPPDLALLPGQLREFLAGKRDKLKGGDEKRFLKEYSQSLVEKLEGKLRELTVTNERLRKVDEFKTEFMQSISHELSTPLTPLAGYLKILQSEKLGPLNERQKKIVDSMLQSADRLAHTIDNLSDFAVLETGNYRVRAESVDPIAIAQKVVDEAQATVAKAKRIHLMLARPAAPFSLAADPARLEQALGNLVDNAIKFSPHGGEVLVEFVPMEDRLLIGIYDQGSGVSPEDQERIFEPFHHAKGARYIATVGLGLPVARKIAEAHGGRLRVESPPKVQPESERHFSGAKFVLELPLVQPVAAQP
ncbi:MAG: response regulator [Deltaproteobacteria bacterium]|nr:response regulator [Deltaproteobacteria bacterium]